MYAGVLALLSRSLRVDVRSRGAHLARLGLVFAIYLAAIQVQLTSSFLGAPGLSFFQSILVLNLTFLTLIGIGAFSSTITEEKEEDTLGLLQMAGIDSLGLLLGKVGGRLTQALALLVVQYPFTLLSITMGGVTHAQVRAAYMALAAFLVMLAGLGVLCSTVSQTSRASARLMVLALVLYGILPGMCGELVREMARSGTTSVFLPAISFLSTTCVFLQADDMLTTGFSSPVLNGQVVSNAVAGIVCFVLAWALFDVCSRSPRTEPVTRGFLTHNSKKFRWFNPGRPQWNPLVWKDFHFVAGGISGLLVRAGCYAGLFGLIWGHWILPLPQDSTEWKLQEACRDFLLIQVMALAFEASLLVSRALRDEVRGQTISALVMLPHSVPAILYSKLGGALMGLIPELALLVIAFANSGLIEEFSRLEGGANSPFGTVYAFQKMLLLLYLTAVIALIARWGATPLAIVAFHALQVVDVMLMGLIGMVMESVIGDHVGSSPVSVVLGVLPLVLTNLGVNVACHFEIIRRFRKLAEDR